jgi:uncharacterized DUF497 family protein
MEFNWDKGNRGHVAEHAVSPEEAEQVVLNEPLDLELQIHDGEERTLQVGETDAGRILIVVTTWREQKVRVVTAFPANKKIRGLYAKYTETGTGKSHGGESENP